MVLQKKAGLKKRYICVRCCSLPVCRSASSRFHARPDFINEALPGLFLFLLPCGIPCPQAQETQHIHFVDFLHAPGCRRIIGGVRQNHWTHRFGKASAAADRAPASFASPRDCVPVGHPGRRLCHRLARLPLNRSGCPAEPSPPHSQSARASLASLQFRRQRDNQFAQGFSHEYLPSFSL